MDAHDIGGILPARIAVLGTLAEFHREPIPYDMAVLVRLVTQINPDMLCLDISPHIWLQKDFKDLSPEYREGLLPLAYQTDMVVVPIGSDDSPAPAHAPGWRGRLIKRLRASLAGIQRRAPGLDAVNRGLRHEAANLLYHIILLLAGSGAFDQRQNHTEKLVQRTLEVAKHNPGARILVIVNVQYCHVLRPQLRESSGVSLITYTDL